MYKALRLILIVVTSVLTSLLNDAYLNDKTEKKKKKKKKKEKKKKKKYGIFEIKILT